MNEILNNKKILDYLEDKNIKIFFSGIGGISMSAIAHALAAKNYKIGGSDINESVAVKKLRDAGIEIFIGHEASNIKDYDLIVYNARIKSDNPEIIRAEELGLPIFKRAQMLGALMHGKKYSIGISGTHGKSSVTSMTSEIFMCAETEPTFFIGAVYPPVDSAYKIGKNDNYFILESDEYCDSFLNFFPTCAVILNIEMDHPDYFKDLAHVKHSFGEYLNNTSEIAIINADDLNAVDVAKCFNKRIIYYGIENKSKRNENIYVENVNLSTGFASFDIIVNNDKSNHELYAKINLKVPGEFNIYNALAAASVAYAHGLDGKFVEQGLNKFAGAARRFEFKGNLRNGAKIFEDYAHHPTELRKTLIAADNAVANSNGKVWCIFQPHTYSRTLELMPELETALKITPNAEIILTEIYSATEENKFNLSSEKIAQKINCQFADDFSAAARIILNETQPEDLILITGAGDINKLTDLILAN